MGLIDYKQLQNLHEAAQEDGSSAPISAFRFPIAKATEIVEKNGKYIFGEQIDFDLQLNRRTIICLPDDPNQSSKPEQISLFRLELKGPPRYLLGQKESTENPNGLPEDEWKKLIDNYTERIQGKSIVLSESPRSTRWYHVARIKKSQKDRSRLPVTNDKNFREAIDLIEGCTSDYWESGAFLTAGLLSPSAPFDWNGEVFTVLHGALLIGICRDPETVTRKILCSLKHVLDDVEAGTFSFSPPKGIRYNTWPAVYDNVIEQANSLLYAAINQALAGPDDGEPDSVEALALQIFKNNLYQACQREERYRKSLVLTGDDSDFDGKLSRSQKLGGE